MASDQVVEPALSDRRSKRCDWRVPSLVSEVEWRTLKTLLDCQDLLLLVVEELYLSNS